MKRNFTLFTFIFILLIINILLFYDNKFINSSEGDSSYDNVSLSVMDRAFGDTTTSAPIRSCTNFLAKQVRYNITDTLNSQIELREGSTIGDYSSYTRSSNPLYFIESCREDLLRPYLAYGDLDGDFLSEVLTIGYKGDITLYFNNGLSYAKTIFSEDIINGNDRFLVRKNLSGEVPKYKGVALFMDVNKDFLNDILLTPDESRDYITIIKNKGNRLFDYSNPIYIKTERHGGEPDSVTTDDLNKDGVSDIIMTVRMSFNESNNNGSNGDKLVRIFLSNDNNYYIEKTNDMIPDAVADESTQGGAGQVPNRKPEPVASNKVRAYQPFTPLVHDFDNDGLLDIFLASDGGGSRVFFQENGKFIDYTKNSSVGSSQAGMGAELYDFNGDGLLDIFTTEISYENSSAPFDRAINYKDVGNAVFINNGDRSFSVSGTFDAFKFSKNELYREQYSDFNNGLRYTGFAWGFSSSDLNLDGYHDYFIGAGMSNPSRSSQDWFAVNDKPYLLMGSKGGVWFDGTKDIFRSLQFLTTSQLIASTDFNGDFRADILILSDELKRPYLLLNNTVSGNKGAGLIIRGKGSGGSPYNGEGSIIKIMIKDRPVQMFKLPSKLSNYKSYGGTAPIIIGLGREDHAVVEVRFSSGKKVIKKIVANKINIISE